MAKARKNKKARKVNVEPKGRAYIQASFNNVIVTMTNSKGEVVSWGTAGKAGFKGSKKNTPYAAQLAAKSAATDALEAGMRSVVVYVKGPGAGREAAIREIDATGIKVTKIVDVTPIPHNGCRPPKKRRV